MESSILSLLAESEWDVDDLLSDKSMRVLVVNELSRMEGYIIGLTELNKMLNKQLEGRRYESKN